MALTFTKFFEGQLLTAALTSVTTGTFAGVLHEAKLVPFTNTLSPNENNVYSDLVLSTSTGLVAQLCAFGTPYFRVEGGYATQSALLLFQLVDLDPSTVLMGYGLIDSATTPNLLALEMFTDPVTLADPTQALIITAQVGVGSGGSGSATVVE